jgi:hypothetical protein
LFLRHDVLVDRRPAHRAHVHGGVELNEVDGGPLHAEGERRRAEPVDVVITLVPLMV